MFVQNTNGIPPLVLKGRIPKYKSVNTVYLTSYIQNWFREAWRSYLMRSDLGDEPNMKKGGTPVIGQPDDDGYTWKQLQPRTYKIKAKLQANDSYKEYISGIQTRAAQAVLGVITNMSYAEGDGTNIRTGRTLASFAPPAKSGNKLLKGPDQKIIINDNQVEVDSTVDYADEVLYGHNYGRALYDEDVDSNWAQRAIIKALKDARIEYDRLVKRMGEPEYVKKAKERMKKR
jgi:hypothetical protein